MPARQNNFKHLVTGKPFFIPHVSERTHVLSSVFAHAAEEDVGTATSGDCAEFFNATNPSDNTGALKLESLRPDRQRPLHFLAVSKAALPNTQASPTLLKLFMLEAESLLHKMLTPGGGFMRMLACVTFTKMTGLCLRSKWSNPCDSIFRSCHVCGGVGAGLALVQLHWERSCLSTAA